MVIFKNKNNPWVFMPICSASVEGHEKLLKISVCKFHKLFRNTNQLNLSPIKSYINNWAMDNSRASCFCLLECAQLEVLREIMMGMDYPVYLCYGNVQLFVIFFCVILAIKTACGKLSETNNSFSPPLSYHVNQQINSGEEQKGPPYSLLLFFPHRGFSVSICKMRFQMLNF